MTQPKPPPGTFNRAQLKAVKRLASRGEPQHLGALLALLGRQDPTDRGLEQLGELLQRAKVVAEPSVATLDSNLAEVRLAFASRWRRLWAAQVVSRGWRGAVAVATLLNVAGAIIAIVAIIPLSSGPTKMTGDLTVAVSPFSVTGAGQAVGADVATAVEKTLRRRFGELETAVPVNAAPLRTETRGPRDVGTVAGKDQATRANNAQRVAAELNADIVVYGSIRFRRGQTQLNTEVYVRAGALPDAPELSGPHPIIATLTVPVGANGRNVPSLLAGKVISETRWVAALSLGLGWYQVRDLPDAKAYLSIAERSGGSLNPVARALLALLRGNIAAREGRLHSADRAYRRSLAAVPLNPRALFGLAEVVYQRTRGRCQLGRVGVAGLKQALRQYKAVASQSQDATVYARAQLGEAKTLICLSEAGAENAYSEAEKDLRVVIDDFDRGDDRIQEETAEAYGLRGLMRLVPRPGESDRARFVDAASDYQKAKELALTDNRKAVLTAQRSHVLALLGDFKEARKEYATARDLDRRTADTIGPPTQTVGRPRTP